MKTSTILHYLLSAILVLFLLTPASGQEIGVDSESEINPQHFSGFDGELLENNFSLQGSQPGDQFFSTDFYSPGFDRIVRTVVEIGDDIFIGGDFNWYNGNKNVRNIARLNGDTVHPVGEGLSHPVIDMVEFNGDLLVLMSTSTFSQTFGDIVLRWDGSEWTEIPTGLHKLRGIMVFNGQLVGAGSFVLGGSSSNGFAVWDGENWEALYLGLTQFGFRTWAVHDDKLWMGGSFFDDGTYRMLYSWDGETFQLGINAESGFIDDLIVRNGELIAAGLINVSPVKQQEFSRLVSIKNGSLETIETFGFNIRNLAEVNGELIAIGFESEGDQYSASWNLYRHNGSSFEPYNSEIFEADLPRTRLYSLSDGRAIMYGDHVDLTRSLIRFTILDGESHEKRYDNYSANGLFFYGEGVTTTTIFEDKLLAGGVSLREGSGQTLINDASWDGQSWNSLGDQYRTSVRTLNVTGNSLYAGGNGFSDDITNRDYVSEWNGSSWEPFPGTFIGQLSDIHMINDELYAAGNFSGPTRHIARWNGQEWVSVNEDYRLQREVNTLITFEGELILGGRFLRAESLTGGEDITLNGVARYDGEQFLPMGEGLTETSPFEAMAEVYALYVFNNELYAAGRFTFSGDVALSGIARWDGQNWQPVGEGFNGPVRTLTEYDGMLVAGGLMTHSGTTQVNGLAAWDGEEWMAIGSGVNAPVLTLSADAENLYIGGSFTTAGGVASNSFAVFNGDLSSIGVGVEVERPQTFNLKQNYPNPFNPTTNISFTLPETSEIRLEIYNALGQRVALAATGIYQSGTHTVQFDASSLSSGMYIYRITAGSFAQSRTMILVK